MYSLIMKLKIFISSVQKEFAEERRLLALLCAIMAKEANDVGGIKRYRDER